MSDGGWSWDPTLYAGSAPFYPVGRVPYPAALAERLAEALHLDGHGRLLDVGCGPGSLTLLLAPLFAEVVGVDADADMLAEGARQARRAAVGHVTWRHLRAEELPADLAPPTVVTFAQSFHWMDRPTVAAAVRTMLAPGGALVHVGATTHEGMPTDDVLPHPRPPREAIGALVRHHLGDARRAGRSVVPASGTPGDEDDVYRAAGFRGPRHLELPARTVERTAEEIRASVYSLSRAAPHLFGADLEEFDAGLRALLDGASPDGRFSERLCGITLSLWR
ncbi:class I SAM-dependent methyltransferase [Actinomycetospora endophytica]|uniref:Class I SAM-dependent methyltransferase n=1 Tax=Actinomycetospora endophytica TaxID=2291215 RepID=A0ABS8P9G5_9PSEU|nr:class I SAM-dependent methyltransferase [Actinomycetospora endophytica]MCD2194894.1 class I SAM-dependent methyltransferase [Actinomycetospora endophytica]